MFSFIISRSQPLVFNIHIMKEIIYFTPSLFWKYIKQILIPFQFIRWFHRYEILDLSFYSQLWKDKKWLNITSLIQYRLPRFLTPNIYLYSLSMLRILLLKFCVYRINIATVAKAETGIKLVIGFLAHVCFLISWSLTYLKEKTIAYYIHFLIIIIYMYLYVWIVHRLFQMSRRKSNTCCVHTENVVFLLYD